jgi:hypothetical protein
MTKHSAPACAPAGRAGLDALLELAAAGLEPMFDPERRMFCQRRRWGSDGLVNEGLSARYTLMSILGLTRWKAAGRRPPVDSEAALRNLAGGERIRSLGDFGLLLWACAEAAPDLLPAACAGIDIGRLLAADPQGRRGLTTEVAWLLAGLSHGELASAAGGAWADAAFHACRILMGNQGPHGLFGHLDVRSGLTGAVRGRIGSFADQVYPIYALARFSQAYRESKAVAAALRCAEAICRAQGSCGQWWWHYDARTGRVVERYPVYSVHQHGMAPMALLALTEAAGADFSAPVRRGLGWIDDRNESGCGMVDAERRIIWRGVYCGSKWTVYRNRLMHCLGGEDRSAPVRPLPVRRECRPYELGWLLYAFAGRSREILQL